MIGLIWNTPRGTIYPGETQPTEPPDDWGEEGEEEEDDTPDWVYDEEHSYVLRGGKVICCD